MIIYAIEHRASGRRYIGRTAQRPSLRWCQHKFRLRKGTHSALALQTAWTTDGEDAFVFTVLEHLGKFATKQDAATRERWHLQSTNSPFNQSEFTLSGPSPGFKHTPEAIARMRAAQMGKKFSAEHRRNISAARKGRSYPRQGGYTLSAETRAKMRAAHLGLKGTVDSRAKQSAALRGRTFTEEWKAKIRASKTGVPWSQQRRDAHVSGVSRWPINF